MGETDARRRVRVWIALAAVYVIWGSTYLGIEVAGRTIPPLLMLSARFLIAGALLYALAIRRGERVTDRPRLVHWRTAFVVGGALLFLGNGGVALAVRDVPTGTVALIVGSIPLWFALFDRLFNGVRLAPVAIVGLVAGFGGIAILVEGNTGGGRLTGVVVVLVGSLAWALGTLYARGAPMPRRPLVAAAMQMLAGGLLLGLTGLALGEGSDLHVSAISAESLFSLAYLILAGSFLGFTAYVWLVANAPLALVGTYAYVNPVVAVLLGALLVGEPFGLRLVLAGGLVIAAVGLIVSATPRPAPAARPSVTLDP